MKRHLFLILALLALLLAACGSNEPATPEPVSFTIEMTEYAFTPNEINVSVGQQVTFHLINDGQLQHEIMIGRDLVTADGHANGYTIDLFKHAGVEPEVHGGILMIDGEMRMEDMRDDDHQDEQDEEMAMADDDMENEDEAMDNMAMEDDPADDEAMHMDDAGQGHNGLMVMLPENEDIATMTFTVTEEMLGTWEIGCFELDGVHYDAGMRGTFTVTDS